MIHLLIKTNHLLNKKKREIKVGHGLSAVREHRESKRLEVFPKEFNYIEVLFFTK